MGLPQPSPTRRYTFIGGGNAVADQVENELNTVYTVLQGGVADVHVADGANINGAKIADGSISPTKLLGAAFVPVGSIIDWWSDTSPLPAQFMVCDGSKVNDATSPLNGLTLPNLTNLFTRGVANANLRNTPQSGGEDTHLLTVAETPDHGHSITDPGHTHGMGNSNGALYQKNNINFTGAGLNVWSPDPSGLQLVPLTNTTGIGINHTGGGLAHNNVPAWYGVVKIIRIK